MRTMEVVSLFVLRICSMQGFDELCTYKRNHKTLCKLFHMSSQNSVLHNKRWSQVLLKNTPHIVVCQSQNVLPAFILF